MGRRALGVTSYNKKVISFSKTTLYYDTLELNKNTLLHEIAHVLAPRSGHGKLWKEKCMITGAEPKSCCSTSLIEKPWFLVCKTCIYYKKYYRRNLKYIKCRKCKTPGSYKKNENFKNLNH